MDASIIVIEDERDLAELMAIYLKDEGIETTIVETAEEGLARIGDSTFDLIVLDLNLPGMDGFEFLRKFRGSSALPVLIVSSREADEDMILGLGLGADEFVSKPFSPRVLAARVKAHLRRSQGVMPDAARSIARFGPFAVDLDCMMIERDGSPLAAPAKEVELLAYFLRHRGEALKTETIYRDVWDNPYGDLTTVAVHVQRLRRRIEPDPSQPRYIRTVYGVGYRFDIPVESDG
jgi:two-component system response regulator RegX3